MVDPSVLTNHPEYYYRTLMQSSIISQIVYESDPLGSLIQNFKDVVHGIRNACVSKTFDDPGNLGTDFDIKYLVSDCSIDENNKVLIVGFRGIDPKNESVNAAYDNTAIGCMLYDLKTDDDKNKWEGHVHTGFYQRSEKIPIKFFTEKIIKEKKKVANQNSPK